MSEPWRIKLEGHQRIERRIHGQRFLHKRALYKIDMQVERGTGEEWTKAQGVLD